MIESLNLELTMEQKFELARMKKMLDNVPTREIDELKELVHQSARLIMIKDNVIKQLMKGSL